MACDRVTAAGGEDGDADPGPGAVGTGAARGAGCAAGSSRPSPPRTAAGGEPRGQAQVLAASRARRSWLFVPGDRPERYARALGSGAHAVIFDLEDSVAAERVEDARRSLSELLSADRQAPGVQRFVRVRESAPYKALHADLAAVVGPGLDGVVLPKVDDAGVIARIDAALEVWESLRALAPGGIRIAVLVESPSALGDAAELAGASPRVTALCFGAEDYARATGLAADGGSQGLIHARASLAMAGHAAGVEAVDMVSREFRDLEALERSVSQGRSLGFGGKLAIHPDQVATINAGFRANAAELERARRVVRAYEEAGLEGRGVLSVDGEMVDAPVVERARRLLADAERP